MVSWNKMWKVDWYRFMLYYVDFIIFLTPCRCRIYYEFVILCSYMLCYHCVLNEAIFWENDVSQYRIGNPGQILLELIKSHHNMMNSRQIHGFKGNRLRYMANSVWILYWVLSSQRTILVSPLFVFWENLYWVLSSQRIILVSLFCNLTSSFCVLRESILGSECTLSLHNAQKPL
jgi:hypothetical protein